MIRKSRQAFLASGILAAYSVFLLLQTSGKPAAGQSATPPPGGPDVAADAPPKTITRLYDLSEILFSLPDYRLPLDPEAPKAQPGPSYVPPPDPEAPKQSGLYQGAQVETLNSPSRPKPYDQRVQDVIKLIEENVDSVSWQDSGGTVGSIRELDSIAIITQTAENQRAVEALLNMLRRRKVSNFMIQIDADWLMLTPEQISAWQKTQKSLPQNGSARYPATAPVPATNSDAINNLLRDFLQDPSNVYCHARTTGFNDQIVSIDGGRSKRIVANIDPVEGNISKDYQVNMARIQLGAALQVRPRLLRKTTLIADDGMTTPTTAPSSFQSFPIQPAEDSALIVDVSATVKTYLPNQAGAPPAVLTRQQFETMYQAMKVALEPVKPSHATTTMPFDPHAATTAATIQLPSANNDAFTTAAIVEAALSEPDRFEQHYNGTVVLQAGVPMMISAISKPRGAAGARELCLILTAHIIPTTPTPIGPHAAPGQ